jgi:hypothetical protein
MADVTRNSTLPDSADKTDFYALVDNMTVQKMKPATDSTTALQLQNAAASAILTVDTTNSKVGIGKTPNTANGGKLEVVDGISFPATQVPCSNVNTLDDYEEGDWTAAFVCGTSGTITITPNVKTGAYVKIGKQVTVTGRFTVDSVSSPVGQLIITGLPFTCGNDNKYSSVVNVHATELEVTATTSLTGYVPINTTTMYIQRFTAGAVAAMAADVKATSDITISATYFTD